MDLSSPSRITREDTSSRMTRVSWSRGSHGDHLNSALSQLQSSSCLVDTTLVSSSGTSVKCHRIVLASVSGVLRSLLEQIDEKVR